MIENSQFRFVDSRERMCPEQRTVNCLYLYSTCLTRNRV